MPLFTILIGDLLLAVGVVGYVLSSYASWTALIPALFGVVFNLLGGLALAAPKARKHAMHAACVVALLGVAGTAKGLLSLPTLLTDSGKLERPAAVASQSITAIVCLVFLVVCVNSFIRARRKAGTPA